MEPSGRSRGVGVCEFVAVDQATSAISKFTGYVCASRSPRLPSCTCETPR